MPDFEIGSLGTTGSTLVGALILDFVIQWVRPLRCRLNQISLSLIDALLSNFKNSTQNDGFCQLVHHIEYQLKIILPVGWLGRCLHLQDREIL